MLPSLLIIQIAEPSALWLPVLAFATALVTQLYGIRMLSKHILHRRAKTDSAQKIKVVSQILTVLLLVGFTILYVNLGIAVVWAVLWAILSAVFAIFILAFLLFLMFPKLLKAYQQAPKKEDTSPI